MAKELLPLKVKNQHTYYEKLLSDYEVFKKRFEFVVAAFDESGILLNPVPLKREIKKSWSVGRHRANDCPNYNKCLDIAGVCHNWKSFTCRYCLGFWSRSDGLSKCNN